MTRTLVRRMVPMVATLVVALTAATSCAHYCAAAANPDPRPGRSHCGHEEPARPPQGDCCKDRLTAVSDGASRLDTGAALAAVPVPGVLAVAPAPPMPVVLAATVPLDRPPPGRSLLLQHTALRR